MRPTRLRGLYAITDAGEHEAALIARAAAALAGGAALLQYRDKHAGPARRAAVAARLLSLCRARDVPLIINDDVALAARIGAHGVHLGRDDPDPRAARAALGADALIGVSCYADLSRARAAVAAGADYVAFGRFFPSVSKPQATPAPVDLLRRARAELAVPLVAIGGITPDNGRRLIEAGADLLAVIHGVFGQPDVRAAAAAYTALFSPEHP